MRSVTEVEGVETPPVCAASQLTSSTDLMPSLPSGTSAVTRSWSDVNQMKMLMTFGATSFTYSVLGQPLFLAIARQQCCKGHVTAFTVLSDEFRSYGIRGLYRGAGAAISGTVLSELVYYGTVEYFKEKLPFEGRETRSFGAGLLADVSSTPVFNPFAVVSQVQMVAGSAFSSEHNYMSAWRTTVTLVKEQGIASLFRGTLLTLLVAPMTGAWWFIYEFLKRHAYGCAPAIGACIGKVTTPTFTRQLPWYLTSTTDNVLINCGVGAAASMIVGIIMNPIYVLRLRLQVLKPQPGVRFPAVHIVQDVLRNEGVSALWKGLGVNLLIAVIGGCAFGVTYEGTKKFSDTSEE